MRTRRRILKIGLTGLTVLCLFWAGLWAAFRFSLALTGATEFWTWSHAIVALCYVVALGGIVLAHEAGHLVMAAWHGVPTRGPYLIPMPLPLTGTLGAVLVLDATPETPQAQFDIAIAGPLVGFGAACLVLLVGLPLSQTADLLAASAWPTPWLLSFVSGDGLVLHPLAQAGWIGLLMTGLNLVPIYPLDGGQIVAALWSREPMGRRRWAVLGATVIAAALCVPR